MLGFFFNGKSIMSASETGLARDDRGEKEGCVFRPARRLVALAIDKGRGRESFAALRLFTFRGEGKSINIPQMIVLQGD
jgi:hypothetical protein